MPPRQLPDRQLAARLSRLIGNAELFSEHPAIQVRDQGSGLPALSA
jgi:hypothetical protein